MGNSGTHLLKNMDSLLITAGYMATRDSLDGHLGGPFFITMDQMAMTQEPIDWRPIFLGLCKGISPQNMTKQRQKYGTVPPI